MRKVIASFLVIIALFLFFAFRLTETPSGITIDEGAFGYNGILLSQTLHDENGRFMPIFVLSIHGNDWRQPVTQYMVTLFFKVLGASVYNLRLVSVFMALLSVIFIFFLGKKLLGTAGGIAASVFLTSTPVFMIHSHLGLDNIAPVPFVIAWLFFLYLFSKKKENFLLILSAISLGVGYYSYKGMRVFVPIWIILTIIFLSWEFLVNRDKKTFKNVITPVLYFSLSAFPFFAIIPYLETKYAGAVLNNEHPVFEGFYHFLYPYFSMFDPSFLFIKGDELFYHSTGKHGMYLLLSLPFFVTGLVASFKKGSFWKLIIASFFLGPLLFGLFGSIHRASRMLAEVPLYALICAAGVFWFWKKKSLKLLLGALVILFAVNYYDFINYYWYQYPKDTESIFYHINVNEDAYKFLKAESEDNNFVPFVDSVVSRQENTTVDFARTMSFIYPPMSWDGKKDSLPSNSVLMTSNSNITYLTKIKEIGDLCFYLKN